MDFNSSAKATGHGDPVELTDRNNTHNAHTKNEVSYIVQDANSGSGSEQEVLEEQDGHLRPTKSSHEDIVGMRRMGKDQQLVRTFRQLSITSFVALATATWEIGLFIISPGLQNGGRAGLLWSALWCWVGFLPIYLSMAEMASMAPIAGAQYHWVSEFAPDKYQKGLSYLAGWISTIAWQAGNAMGFFLTGSLVQTIILINNENYPFPPYQGTLLAIAMAVVSFVTNVYGTRFLPYWQNVFFALHVLAYFAYIVPIWVNAPVASHSAVWTTFANEGGWSSMGLTILAGQLTGISEQVGIDTTAHMSEEVKHAAKAIPKAMLTVYLLNFLLLFPALVTICYHVPDLLEALEDSTTYPAVYVLRVSMSPVWVSVILALIALICIASCINYFAAVTRDLFAFARDDGLPFSKWLSTVHPTRHIPVNASIVSTVIGSLLALIYIGSPVAFYAITSLSTVSLLMCYTMSIGSILYRRIAKPETLPPAHFSLGKYGVLCNSLAVAFGSWAFFWCFWPSVNMPSAADFNWASPIFGAAALFALVYYVLVARHKYVGPVAEVEGRGIAR